MTLAINPQFAVSPKPVLSAAIPGAEPNAESRGGFQKHLNQSLQRDHDASSAEGSAIDGGTSHRREEKAARKRRIAEDLAAPVTAQLAERQLIHLPAGSIISLDASPETEVESPDQPEPDADCTTGAAAILLTSALSDAGSKVNVEAAKFGMAAGTPPVAGPAVRQAEDRPLAGASPSATMAEAGSGKQDELAFAARVEPASAAAQADTPAARPFRMALKPESINRVSTEDKFREPKEVSDPTPNQAPRLTSFETIPTPDAAPPMDPRVENPPEVARIDMPAPSQSRNVTPLRDLSVQLGQATDQRVEVRLAQRGGELRVTVSTPNLDLARGLRQGIPEVVGRLSESGFRTETWHPGATATAVTAAAEASNASSDFQRQDPQGRSGAHHQDQQQQRGQQHTDRPKWLEELEGRFSNRESRGELHGFSN